MIKHASVKEKKILGKTSILELRGKSTKYLFCELVEPISRLFDTRNERAEKSSLRQVEWGMVDEPNHSVTATH